MNYRTFKTCRTKWSGLNELTWHVFFRWWNLCRTNPLAYSKFWVQPITQLSELFAFFSKEWHPRHTSCNGIKRNNSTVRLRHGWAQHEQLFEQKLCLWILKMDLPFRQQSFFSNKKPAGITNHKNLSFKTRLHVRFEAIRPNLFEISNCEKKTTKNVYTCLERNHQTRETPSNWWNPSRKRVVITKDVAFGRSKWSLKK